MARPATVRGSRAWKAGALDRELAAREKAACDLRRVSGEVKGWRFGGTLRMVADGWGTAKVSYGLHSKLSPLDVKLGADQKLTTSARIALKTSKTHVATWHGTASVSSSPAPQAHKSFSRYGGGVLIRAARPRSPSTSPGADIAKSGLTGGQLLVSRGGSFLASAEDVKVCGLYHPQGTGYRLVVSGQIRW